MATTITVTPGKKNVTVTNISNNEWVEAKVESIVQETPDVKTYSFALPQPAHHKAGQHFELRLTAPNGYQAARPYSASSSSKNMPQLELTIQHVPDGEVSSYLFNTLEIGDSVEVRGPFGKFFTWDESIAQPILLIAGGSGVVPMHSIFTTHQLSNASSEMQLIYSARMFENIIFKDDFLNKDAITITLTQDAPSDWHGATGRINQQLFDQVLERFTDTPLCYVCGMSSFVSVATDLLQKNGVPIENIKTERFA